MYLVSLKRFHPKVILEVLVVGPYSFYLTQALSFIPDNKIILPNFSSLFISFFFYKFW